MSNTKLAAAKELIQEKRYSEARAVLRTVNDPTAMKWLAKLDEIDPQPSQMFPAPQSVVQISPEAERYYRRENQRANRRRVGNGIYLIFMGIACLAIFAFLAMPTPSFEQNGRMVSNPGLGCLFVPLGLLAIAGGIYRLRRRD